ncbi:hypothetical protein CKG00_14375 (plasmid) [Morganella morganii]|uniref:Uncharacterized protein n=1 Tax=Morganella morganii TaxID=582 RepID=A0A433ZQI3_MORMO|nr:hypothetical protein CKG00_14375 [Morganella morganii]
MALLQAEKQSEIMKYGKLRVLYGLRRKSKTGVLCPAGALMLNADILVYHAIYTPLLRGDK